MRAPPTSQPTTPHEPGHTLAARAPAAGAQLCVDARAAIAAVALGVDRGHLQGQPTVLSHTSRLGSCLPGVKAGPRNAQRPAKGGDGETGLLRLDERKPHAWSLAKKAAAFFRISRS